MVQARDVGLDEALAALDRLATDGAIALERDVPLGPLTTLRVGGPADRVATPRTAAELADVLTLAREAAVPTFILGKGSDLVVADAGIRGLVVRNRADNAYGVGQPATSWVVESGTPMAKLVKEFTSLGLTGLEFGISIPGTVGGAVWANAGAHGGEMRDVVRRVEAFDPRDGATRTLEAAELAFAYRESRFKHTPEVVLEAVVEVARGDAAEVAARVDAHQAQRRATQPLADQNAGSVFRNPPDDHAGRLVDEAGLKGFRIGSAQVSTLHANFIVVDRGGRAADVRLVGDQVRAVVAERFGVELEYEIEFVGDWPAAASAA
jgi:UDP-N-acetylmuramate dehydrogenase